MTSGFATSGGVDDASLMSTLADRPMPVEPVLSAQGGDEAQPATLTSLFNDMLASVQSSGSSDQQGERAKPGVNKELREAAEMFVSTSMIMPLFQQMRNDPLATNLIHGGRAESIFQQQLDQVLSDRIASATRFDIVDAVYNQLARNIGGGGVIAHG